MLKQEGMGKWVQLMGENLSDDEHLAKAGWQQVQFRESSAWRLLAEEQEEGS